MGNIINMRADGFLKGFQDFIKHLKATQNLSEFVIVEIGSYTGQSTTMFADEVKIVIAIDPFMNDYDDNDVTCHSADIPTEVYTKFLENISPYKNISHIRMTSDDAIKTLENLKVDLVYIDGVHTYDQVKKDIENYKPIIKAGGLICGHDYSNEGHVAGVYKAVNEAFGKPDLTFIDNSWLVQL
jgi:predicted O-methyltransferase YrrM